MAAFSRSCSTVESETSISSPICRAPGCRPKYCSAGGLTTAISGSGSLVEVVDLVGSDELGRKADAIEVFERLLLDAGMQPSRYQELRKRYPDVLAPALEALHAVLVAR